MTAAYVQTLLLTGARPGEVLALRWEDVNTQWMSLTIPGQGGRRTANPLTPMRSLLAALPRQ